MKSSGKQLPQRYNTIQTRQITSPVRRKRRTPLALVIAADILLTGIGLCLFALFHHVLPRDIQSSGQALPSLTTVSATTTADAVSTAAPAVTSVAGGATQSSTESRQTAAATDATIAKGLWGARFAGHFTDGAIEKTGSTYRSANISIAIDQVKAGKVTYYVADIYLRDIRYFRTAFAGGKYARGVTDEVLDMAKANQAILAISGDYYGIRDRGIVIRNGELYREKLFQDVLVMNNDGSMETFTAAAFDINAVKARGAWQAWSFGPMLLQDGKPMTTFNSDVTALNPRGAIGYYEPGHYCFVLVDGRQDGYSIGMTMAQLSQLFADLGCKAAYNLDGGQSAVMTFMDGWANQPYRGGRKISDIIYIGE